MIYVSGVVLKFMGEILRIIFVNLTPCHGFSKPQSLFFTGGVKVKGSDNK